MQILLVDDNATLRHTLTALLQNVGHEVEACHDCDDAWIKLETSAKNYGLVVTDVRMPRMTGVEFATRLRAQGSQTPIIFIAGGREVELEPPLPEFVPYAVLHKPFSLNTFLDAMKRLSPAIC